MGWRRFRLTPSAATPATGKPKQTGAVDLAPELQHLPTFRAALAVLRSLNKRTVPVVPTAPA